MGSVLKGREIRIGAEQSRDLLRVVLGLGVRHVVPVAAHLGDDLAGQFEAPPSGANASSPAARQIGNATMAVDAPASI